MNLKAGLRSLAYETGFYRAYHRALHRDTLTVLGFHRVIPVGDERSLSAMPEFTISTSTFEGILVFFSRYYNIVSVEKVRAAAQGGAPLPPFAAAITFDDGWADNQEFAAPILDRLGLPATLFLCGGLVDGFDAFWREDLYGAASLLGLERVYRLWNLELDEYIEGTLQWPDGWGLLLNRAERLDEETRARVMGTLRSEAGVTPCRSLMGLEEARTWSRRFSIGAHGYRHDPLTALEDAGADLTASLLARSPTAARPDAWTRTMSFPHGRYDRAISETARDLGFDLLFTSDQCVNRLENGRVVSDVLGRVWASPSRCSRDGHFSAADTANHFFRFPVDVLTGDAPRYL